MRLGDGVLCTTRGLRVAGVCNAGFATGGAGSVSRPQGRRGRPDTEPNRTLAEAGGSPDWLGDALCNEGEHGTRHHAVNRAWQRALAAVATKI